MPGINVPSSSPSILKTALPIAGSVIGGIYGGPAGAAAGGKIGQSLAGGGKDPTAIESKAAPQTAVDRRIGALEEDPSVQLAKADAALRQAPPEIQDQYGPAIAEARKREMQGGV